MSNRLQLEKSPYLKQHQHNPVDWYPWGKEALDKAKSENKLIIISVGYSACHWCHVMERESFENEAVAAVMNRHFVSIKIDREERPDIDQVYMLAVQLMTNSGGWPLNCICLPDGRPIYGGTYFKPVQWKNVLLQLSDMWREQPQVALEYAEKLTNGIKRSEQLPLNTIPENYTEADLSAIVKPWEGLFDTKSGGYLREPKFPLPNNWVFLLRYAVLSNDQALLAHVHFTLRKIAMGGIYDHVGGGFARYSVDGEWHVPHFEKMLYDNAQLVSLYAEAYRQQADPLYKRVVEETLAWVAREMTDTYGGFYCALDADSEGVEGKFYTFEQSELEAVLGTDASLFIQLFEVTETGNWPEEKTNVLKMNFAADQLVQDAGFTPDEWEIYLQEMKSKLLAYRETRIRPGLDDKVLTSWNALMITGLIDAYRTFGTEDFLQSALASAGFIKRVLYTESGGLLHQPAHEGKTIPGFLDDYACTIQAFVSIYEATFEEKWLYDAKKLADQAIDHFYEQDATAFFYTSRHAEPLIARKQEVMDNVIPSSNSIMANQLKVLGTLFDQPHYENLADQLLANVFPQMGSYGSAYSNWGILLLKEVFNSQEIAIIGTDSIALRKELDKYYIPNAVILGGENHTIPFLVGKSGKTTQAYVCRNKACSLPVYTVEELLQLTI